MKEVPWYKSEGFWGIAFLAATAAAPHVEALLEPGVTWQVAIKGFWATVFGFIVAMHGHFRESGNTMITTPRGFPGANKGDSREYEGYDSRTRQ